MNNVADQSVYTDGTYAANNSDWHEDDSPYKAGLVRDALNRTGTAFRTCADVGCGAGLVAEIIASEHRGAEVSGYDISPDAALFWDKRSGVRLFQEDILSTSESFDLILCLDVFEHVEDYIGFLRSLRKHGKRFIFNVPLDLNLAKLLGGFKTVRESVGHLHYFDSYTALATLATAGYKVVNSYFAANFKRQPITSLKHLMVTLPRYVAAPLGGDLSSRLFGGYSLVVTADA